MAISTIYTFSPLSARGQDTRLRCDAPRTHITEGLLCLCGCVVVCAMRVVTPDFWASRGSVWGLSGVCQGRSEVAAGDAGALGHFGHRRNEDKDGGCKGVAALLKQLVLVFRIAAQNDVINLKHRARVEN